MKTEFDAFATDLAAQYCEHDFTLAPSRSRSRLWLSVTMAVGDAAGRDEPVGKLEDWTSVMPGSARHRSSLAVLLRRLRQGSFPATSHERPHSAWPRRSSFATRARGSSKSAPDGLFAAVIKA
jgi:hypothetical protein